MAQSGSVTLSGIDDEGFAIAAEFKAKHSNEFQFNPTQMQSIILVGPQPNRPAKMGYNNMIFSWGSPDGLKLVIELLEKIRHHQEGGAVEKRA